jgi:hypothetical protein
MSKNNIQLVLTDSSKINGILDKLRQDLGPISEDTRDWIMRLVCDSLEVTSSLSAKMTLDSGFRGMGSNILTENAGRLHMYIRHLGKTVDQLFKSVDPTSLDPIPNPYKDWLDSNYSRLSGLYAGMTVAIYIGGDTPTPVGSAIRGDYKKALQIASDAGFQVQSICLESFPDK